MLACIRARMLCMLSVLARLVQSEVEVRLSPKTVSSNPNCYMQTTHHRLTLHKLNTKQCSNTIGNTTNNSAVEVTY